MPKRQGFPILTLTEGKIIYNIIKKKLFFPSHIAGSIRRKEKYINDIDIIIIPGNKNIEDLMYSIFEKIERFGDQIITGIYRYKDMKVLIDFFITTRSELPYSLLQWTGPKTYNIRIRRYVKDKYNWLLNQHGIFYASTSRRVIGSEKIKTEKDLVKFIGTTYYLPQERQ